ncbi:MAG: DNA mismatch repair endonuclease MutL, partial [Armatimonadetes bacterium]|nr:DNA mismatch repair endonuclease MutL [Armatimonadota bacterium]
MTQVRILPENLANRIAAGEVVERPASVVKELLENSIDAGAERIEVILRDGGKKLIEVRDDGAGMSQEDVVLAVQRFATSKIAQDSDLDAIATLGFRGEALPSIGAVCQMKITTRRHDEAEGTALLVEGGEVSDLRAVGCPPGTTVQVANLFYNTPARRKFLATTATERGHCMDWVSRLALAHPEIAFQVTHNDAILLSTPGSGDLESVLAAVYGSNTTRQLVPVNLESDGLHIHGYISTPQVTRATRRHQLFFVNHRFVRSRMLSHALTEAYGMLLPQQKQPVAVIMIEMDPGRVDPNVHPTKIEVRFSNPGEMHNLLQQAVENTLAEAGLRSLPSTNPQPREGPGLPAGRLAPADFQQSGRVKRLRV